MVIIKSHFYIRLYQIMMMILQEWDEIPLRVGVSRKVEMLQVVLMVVGYVESGCGTSGRGTGRWGCDLPARCVELMNDDVCVEDSRERDDCIVSGVHTLFGEIQH